MSAESSGLGDRERGLGRALLTVRRQGRLALPGLRLRTSERKLLLLVVDVLLLNFALGVSWFARDNTPAPLSTALAPIKWYITLTVVWYLWAQFFELYDLPRAASTTTIVRSATLAVAATVLVYVLIPRLTPPLASRGPVFLFLFLAWGGVVAWRIVYARAFVQPWFKQQALVVGAGWAGRTLVEMLQEATHDANPYRGTGYVLRGFIDDNKALTDAEFGGVPVLGGRDVLVPLAQALQVDEIIVAITHRHAISSELFDDLLRCRELGMRITPMPVIYERLLTRVPVQHLGRDLQAALPMEDSAAYRLYLVVKRITDFVIAVLALIPLAVVALWVAIANAISSPGPLLYRQTRVGKGGRLFECIKFRSMIPDAEQHTGAVWAAKDDNRITPVGRILRKTRLDELPQVINVLRGEMSIIGPRPERPQFVETLAQQIPFYRARHAVHPGITGWAQVQYRYGNCQDDARVKLEYDLYYVKHANLLLDLRILLKTVAVMTQFKGQ